MKVTTEKPDSPGAGLLSQARAQQTNVFARTAAGASHTAALLVFVVLALFSPLAARAENVSIVIASNAAPRVEFGAEKLAEAINAAG